MSLTSKTVATLAVVVAVGFAIWLGYSGGRAPAPQPLLSPSPMTETRPTRINDSSFFTRPGAKTHATNVAVAEVSVASTNVVADWEARVDQILSDDSTEVDAKARQMLELLPHLPEAGQVETAQHISNLLADEDYQKFGSYLTNAATPVSVQDVILADVLNRPNEIKLPLLLQTARSPGNAEAAEAREILELYLEEDYGTNWDKWQQEIEKWLKENPD